MSTNIRLPATIDVAYEPVDWLAPFLRYEETARQTVRIWCIGEREFVGYVYHTDQHSITIMRTVDGQGARMVTFPRDGVTAIIGYKGGD